MFEYSIDQLDLLGRLISAPRLAPYMERANNDRHRAIRLYERNQHLSEAVYGMLQGLEIALRNSFHQTLTTNFNSASWYDLVEWAFPQQRQVDSAKRELRSLSKPIESDRMLAELSFGFWTGLTSNHYKITVWGRGKLRNAFPQRQVERKLAYERLNSIRLLRNRVAHHEPIIQRNLPLDIKQIVETIAWICPTTAEWVRETSHFHEYFERNYHQGDSAP